jgi:hypothetical protein
MFRVCKAMKVGGGPSTNNMPFTSFEFSHVDSMLPLNKPITLFTFPLHFIL